MKKLIALALVAVAASGCSLLDKSHTARIIEQPTRATVVVTPDRFIVVDREPIVLRKSQGTTVSWKLAGIPGAQFAERGITIDARIKPGLKDLQSMQAAQRAAPMRDTRGVESVRCTTTPDRREVSCSFPRDLPNGTYAYTIRLVVDGKPVELDPTVMMEE